MIYKDIELNFLQDKNHNFIFEDHSAPEDLAIYYKAFDFMFIKTYCDVLNNFSINRIKYGDIDLLFTCTKCNYQFSSVNEREELDELIFCEEMIIKNIIE